MGNSRGSADSAVGDGPILTEFYLCPTEHAPTLVATVNMPSITGASTVSIAYTPSVKWTFMVGSNDSYAVIDLIVDGVSGKYMQRVTQFSRNNRHREDMKRFIEELRALREGPQKPRKKLKEETKDGSGSKQSDPETAVPGGDSGVPSGDNEGGNGPGQAEVPAVDQQPPSGGHEAD